MLIPVKQLLVLQYVQYNSNLAWRQEIYVPPNLSHYSFNSSTLLVAETRHKHVVYEKLRLYKNEPTLNKWARVWTWNKWPSAVIKRSYYIYSEAVTGSILSAANFTVLLKTLDHFTQMWLFQSKLLYRSLFLSLCCCCLISEKLLVQFSYVIRHWGLLSRSHDILQIFIKC